MNLRRDWKALLGIRLKIWGCVLIHGKDRYTGRPNHYWGAWRAAGAPDEDIRACQSCGLYEHRERP